MAERWTRERRLEHTRGLLLEAAQEVFAEKGFTAATLDDIAYAAGYTKGAIYKHFSTKEELFLAVNEWYWQRYFDTFTEVVSAAKVGAHELDRIAELWQRLSDDRGAEHAALGMEFTLYLLRNPEARERVAARREQVVEALARFITEGMAQVGATLSIPPLTFARILVHTTDSVVLGTKLDDIDLHRPVLEMYMSVIKLP
ncbi:TetR/AcrR family transcriptional regulator [Nocardia sp. NPDC057227]|uniref:TetR/AcrR family transcriptional regulator n=1 Tax=Nocardia sp. NPDC057227 TaxID=3346056 RepID=UPI003640D62A